MIDLTTVSTEGKSDGNASSEQVARIRDLCDEIERIYESDDRYPKITVTRHWSKHNPTISGEIARPTAFRWYLERELVALARKGAQIEVEQSRRRKRAVRTNH